MLVFPPPFKRKCHPRCAKQILDFTLLLQIVKDGVVQGKFLGWFGDWCFRWIPAQGELEGLSKHTLIIPEFIPTSLNLGVFIPFYCQQGNLAPPHGPNSFPKCLHWLQMIPDPLHINASTFPNIPEGRNLLSFRVTLPSAKKGFSHFWEHSATTEKKGKIPMLPVTGEFDVSESFLVSLPTPEESQLQEDRVKLCCQIQFLFLPAHKASRFPFFFFFDCSVQKCSVCGSYK